jgi:hypothetical protein
MEVQHVVSVGGGLASTWKLPERVLSMYPKENVHLVMARLPNEDPDVWRLCDAVEERLDMKITYIGDNLTPWDVFFKVRMMGSTRIDPCSRVLKREALDRWVKENFDPANTIRYIGFTYEEAHRWIDYQAVLAAKGWRTDAPLLHDPTLTREHLMAECQEVFGFVPRLYRWGFSHNNCGGACVKAGHREWARLLRYLPEVYQWWEENELRFQREIGTEATILRDRKGGKTTSLSLQQFRERMESRWQNELPGLDPFEGLDDTPACTFCMAA